MSQSWYHEHSVSMAEYTITGTAHNSMCTVARSWPRVQVVERPCAHAIDDAVTAAKAFVGAQYPPWQAQSSARPPTI